MKLTTIMLLLLSLCPWSIGAQQTTIQNGETITGELTSESETQHYTFVGKTGDKITISLESSDFDPFLQLDNENGDEVASNDDFGGSLNATISETLRTDETYTIIVSSASGSGSYDLTLKIDAPAAITYGEVVEGQLTEEEKTRSYSFNASAGEVITLTLESTDFNTYLSLREWYTDYALVWDDDSGTGTNSFIGPYTVESDTNLIVTVTPSYTFEDIGEGSYRLRLNRAPVEAIAYGETVEGEIHQETPYALYTFAGTAGDRVNITLESDADLTLKMQNGYGTEVAYSDDDGPGANPEIFGKVLDTTDTYTVIVRPFAAGEFGEFHFTMTGEPAPTLDDGPQTLMLSEKRVSDFLTFTGEANTFVRLVIDFTPTNLTSTYISVYQGDTSLGYADSYIYEDFAHVEMEVEVPEDGLVRVSFSDYSLQPVVIHVTMEKIQ
jgi:hypothetical protein